MSAVEASQYRYQFTIIVSSCLSVFETVNLQSVTQSLLPVLSRGHLAKNVLMLHQSFIDTVTSIYQACNKFAAAIQRYTTVYLGILPYLD